MNKKVKYASMEQALEDIHDISIGYDGYKTVMSLEKLIDELKDIAAKGLNGTYILEEKAYMENLRKEIESTREQI